MCANIANENTNMHYNTKYTNLYEFTNHNVKYLNISEFMNNPNKKFRTLITISSHCKLSEAILQ